MKLGALYYPTEDNAGNKVPFDSLFIPYIYKEIYFDGVYIDILNGRKDMTILDVGANIGVTVQHFQPYAKRLLAIEPSPENFAALKKNKEFNKWDNVEVFNMALADQDGEMQLNTLSSNRTCHSLVNDYQQGGSAVKTMRFDTFMEENKIDKVDFVKFDVEGAEDMILRSSGFNNVYDRISAIEVEFHYPTWNLLVEHMIKLGFTARRYDCDAIVVLFTR